VGEDAHPVRVKKDLTLTSKKRPNVNLKGGKNSITQEEKSKWARKNGGPAGGLIPKTPEDIFGRRGERKRLSKGVDP